MGAAPQLLVLLLVALEFFSLSASDKIEEETLSLYFLIFLS